MRRLGHILILAGLLPSLLACAALAPDPTAGTSSSTNRPGPEASTNPTANPTATPQVAATVAAGVRATLEALSRTPEPAPVDPPVDTPLSLPPTPDLTAMVERVLPGVVRIRTDRGSGSGVIFEYDERAGSALVLSSQHVLEGATWIDVEVNDLDTYPGQLRGVDPARDLAVVRVCCGDFQPLAFGDATGLKVGSDVVAIGYPAGLSGSATVTRGIVSALRYEEDRSRWVIQTDAPINPGSSGGPLFSTSGEVMGINASRVDRTGEGYRTEGLGFAISEVTLRKELPALVAGKHAATTPTPDPGEWQTYTDPLYGYELAIAPEWRVDDTDYPDIDVLAPDDYAAFSVVPLEKPAMTLEELTRELIEFREDESGALFELLSVSEGSLESGVQTARVDFRWQGSPEYCVQRFVEVLVLAPEQGFNLTGGMCEHSASRHLEQIEAMQASFALTRELPIPEAVAKPNP